MGTCLEWVDQLKQEALSLLSMEQDRREGREPSDSQEPTRAGIPRDAGRVEGPGVPEDVDVVRASEEARQEGPGVTREMDMLRERRIERPGVSRDVDMVRVPDGARRVEKPGTSRDEGMVRVSEEDQVGTLKEKGRKVTAALLQIQEEVSGEAVSGEISEQVVSKAPGKPTWQKRNGQQALEEQEGRQRDELRASEQSSQDQEQYLEPCVMETARRSSSWAVKHKGLTAGLPDLRSESKYRLERKHSVLDRPESPAQEGSSLPSRLALALRSSVTPRVPPVTSLETRVSLGLDQQRRSTLLPERELEHWRPTIRFSDCPKPSRPSQRLAGPCLSYVSAFNELAKLGDPDLLEVVEKEGRNAGWS